MRLLKIRLRNVKSYGDDAPEVEFADGVNFLSGENGAGKSTLIESIGYALFDVLPYTKSDFLRRGAKTGAITVRIEDEGEVFQVERKFGAVNSWIVYDDGGVSLHEKKDDVLRFLCERLRAADPGQLDNFFRNIVGVQQGMFTAVFKMTPADRKKIFDGIINVNLYRERADARAAVTNRLVTTDIHDLEKKLDVALAFIEEHKDDPAKLAAAEDRLGIARVQALGLTKLKLGLQTRKMAFEATKAKLETLDLELTRLGALIEGKSRALQNARVEAKRSAEAADACARNKAGHQDYLAAEEHLKALEKARTLRDNLVKSLQDLDKRITGAEGTIKAKEAALTRGKEKERKEAEEVLELEKAWKAREKEALDAVKEAGSAKGTCEKRGEAFETARKGEADLLERLGKARSAVDRITEQLQLIEELEKALTSFEQVAKLADGAAQARRTETSLTGQLAKRQEEVEQQEKYKKQLADLTCPFIKERCDRVAPSVFEARVEAVQEKIKGIARDLKDAEHVAEAAAGAEKKLETLRQKKDRLSDARRTLKREWEKARKALTEWKSFWGKYPEFPSENEGDLDLSPFERYAKDLAAEMSQRQRTMKVEVDVADTLVSQAAGKRAKAHAAVEKAEDAQSRLDALREDLKKQKADVDGLAKARAEALGQKKVLNLKLASYGSLDADLAQARRSLEQSKPAHQEFVANARAAAELDLRDKAVLATEAELGKAQAARGEVQARRNEIGASYDSSEASRVAREFEEVVGKLGSAEKEVEGLDRERIPLVASAARLREQRNEVERMLHEKRRLEKLRRLLEDIWEILRALGPRVSERLLEGISARANRVFGILHDQPGQLVWGADYEVRMRQGAADYPFGSLSGGEQMSAALAIQMAMARDFAGSAICIFDEPTVHLDEGRRQRLAGAIRDAQVDAGFTQAFVVSHDDTFGPYVDHQVKLQKTQADGTRVLL